MGRSALKQQIEPAGTVINARRCSSVKAPGTHAPKKLLSAEKPSLRLSPGFGSWASRLAAVPEMLSPKWRDVRRCGCLVALQSTDGHSVVRVGGQHEHLILIGHVAAMGVRHGEHCVWGADLAVLWKDRKPWVVSHLGFALRNPIAQDLLFSCCEYVLLK